MDTTASCFHGSAKSYTTTTTTSSGSAAGSGAANNDRPVAIYRKQPSLGSYTTTPISKHYALNNQILDAFEIHYETQLYTVAYAIGLNFLETALLEIPKHGYFYSKRHDQERMQSSLDAIHVAHLLKEIIAKLRDEKIMQQQQQHAVRTTTTSTPRRRPNRHWKRRDSNSSDEDDDLLNDDNEDENEKDPTTRLLQESELIKVEKLHQLALEQCEIASVEGEYVYEQRRQTLQAEIEALHVLPPPPATRSRANSNSNNNHNNHGGGGGGGNNTRGSIMVSQLLTGRDSMFPSSGGATRAPIHEEELLRSPILRTCGEGGSKKVVANPYQHQHQHHREHDSTGSFTLTPPPPSFGRSRALGGGSGGGDATATGTAATATTTTTSTRVLPPPPPLSSSDSVGSSHNFPLPLPPTTTGATPATTTTAGPTVAHAVVDEQATRTGYLNPYRAAVMAFPEPPKHERASSDLDLQRALYLSGLEVTISGSSGNASANGYNGNYSSIGSSYMFDSTFMMNVIPEQQHDQHQQHRQQQQQQQQQKMALDTFWQGNSAASTDDRHDENDNDLEQLKKEARHLDLMRDHPYLTQQPNATTSTSQPSGLGPPPPPDTLSRRGSTASSTGTPFSYNLKRLSNLSTTSSLNRQSSLTWMGGGGVSINMLMDCYHEDFDALRSRGRVRISTIDTYQGRVPNSANGCTIIAPLLCIHHFHNDQVLPDPGLPDAVIMQVIDEETPNILPKVREDLGLKKDAFIIPSDAHDCLMAQHYMCEEQFVSVCGGSILDETHIQPLVDALKTLGPKKLAASVFFHEHVITILQLKRSASEVWYDILDSLPHVETLSRLGDATTAQPVMRPEFTASDYNGSSDKDWSTLFSSSGADTFPTTNGSTFSPNQDNIRDSRNTTVVNGNDNCKNVDDDDDDDDDASDDDSDIVDQLPPELLLNSKQQLQNAARIRCLDEECLKAALRWYACSVFTDENKAYIDMYKFDEKRLDFDPRVFQAFIWREA